jgi:hypothetical protein
MFGRLRFPVRHPLYPGMAPVWARTAAGSHKVLAGSFPELAAAASRGARASHAIYIVIDEQSPAPSAAERDQLWRWFRAPSFTLVLDSAGRLAAYECEAENGFHLAKARAGGITGEKLCACGRPGPRIPKSRSEIPRLHPAAPVSIGTGAKLE